jgi:hypothetical protein
MDLIDRLRTYASTRKGELADLITEAADALERQTCEDTVSRQQAIDAVLRAEALVRAYGYRYAADAVRELPAVQPQYEELTPEEAASEIASGSTMTAWYWLDDMIRLKQMGYAICRKKG